MKRIVISIAAALLCACSATETPELNLGFESIRLTSNGGTIKVPVEATGTWMVRCEDPQVMIAPSTYTGSCKVSITVPPTPQKEDRVLDVSFEAANCPKCTFVVSQAGFPYLEFEESSYTVPASEGTYQIGLKSNSRWVLISSLALLGIDISPVEGSGDTVLQVTVPRNPKTRQRTISAIFALEDDPDAKATLKIIQTKD